MEAVRHQLTSAADLRIHKTTSTWQRPIWTRVLRVRQLLGPLKAPSNDPYDDSPSRGAGNSLCETSSPVDPNTREVHAPWSNDAASLQHGQTMSPPNLELSNDGSQELQHSTTSTATPSTSSEPSTAASTAPPSSPESDGTLLKSSDCLSEIAFDKAFSENLGGDVYMDKKARIDNSLIQRWNNEIKARLNKDLKGLIECHSGRAGHILFNNQFYMAGTKRGSVLLAEPTIIITCGIKESGKKIAEQLEKLKLHYLEEFGQPIRVRYQRAPSYWAASSTLETATSDPTSTPIYRGWRFDQVGVESKVYSAETTTTCGLKLEFVLQNKDSVRRRYASFGGLVLIGKVIFCMTTAHTFMLDDDQGASDQDEDASGSSNYDSDADMDRGFAPGSSDLTNTKPSFSGTMWHSKLNPASAYSFDGKKTLVKQDGSVINSKTPNSDWALFSLSSFLPLSNRNGSFMLLSVTPEILLSAGNVILLCGADERHAGYLTQTHLSIHTVGGELDVREIVLSNPLTPGASGSWIVRESQVCGYVVAVTNAGRSCLMLPMERAFADIETTFGQSVTIGHELNDAVREERRQARQQLEAAKSQSVHQVRDSTSTNANANNGKHPVPAAYGPTLEAKDQGVSNQDEPGSADGKGKSPGNLHQGIKARKGAGNPTSNGHASHTPAREAKSKRHFTAFFATCVRGVECLVCCGSPESKDTSLDRSEPPKSWHVPQRVSNMEYSKMQCDRSLPLSELHGRELPSMEIPRIELNAMELHIRGASW